MIAHTLRYSPHIAAWVGPYHPNRRISLAENRSAKSLKGFSALSPTRPHPAHLALHRSAAEEESYSQIVVQKGLFQRPVPMIAVKPLFHGNYPGGTGRSVMWMRRVGDGTETTVEQALMRGLITA